MIRISKHTKWTKLPITKHKTNTRTNEPNKQEIKDEYEEQTRYKKQEEIRLRNKDGEVALSEYRTDEGDTNDIPTALREVEEEIRTPREPHMHSGRQL
nr:hypothetical protein [Tanacetum cinerariifolium]